MLLEIFTDSLCSKPPPPSLDILWCKVLFFKTWISVVFSTVFLEKIENHEFSIFFPHSWSLKCRTFFRMVQKYSHLLQGKTVTVPLEQLKR